VADVSRDQVQGPIYPRYYPRLWEKSKPLRFEPIGARTKSRQATANVNYNQQSGDLMNRVVHFELGAESPERAGKFYQEIFGWKIDLWPGAQPYWLATTGPDSERGINGGIMRHADGQPRTVNTIQVESIEEYGAKVTQHGGEVVVPKFPIPGVGWLAYCKDTEGNLFGIHVQDASAK
jgi:uncharacterized protein